MKKNSTSMKKYLTMKYWNAKMKDCAQRTRDDILSYKGIKVL